MMMASLAQGMASLKSLHYRENQRAKPHQIRFKLQKPQQRGAQKQKRMNFAAVIYFFCSYIQAITERARRAFT